jgi:class 3 adenylate cyclase
LETESWRYSARRWHSRTRADETEDIGSRSALEGERKQVTVLFADVKGSMDLAEQVDPEEWHKIMDRFFAILIRSRRSRSQRPRLSIARSRGRPFSVT